MTKKPLIFKGTRQKKWGYETSSYNFSSRNKVQNKQTHTHTHTKEKKRKRTKKYHKQHQTVMLSNSQSDLLTLTFYCKKNNYWLERQLESLKFTNQKQGWKQRFSKKVILFLGLGGWWGVGRELGRAYS